MMEIEYQLPPKPKLNENIYKDKSANQKNYMESLTLCLENKQPQMIEIVRTEDKIDSTLKILANYKIQKPAQYKQIIICCQRERDAEQYYKRLFDLAEVYTEIKENLLIVNVSNKRKLCIEDGRLEKYDEEIYCKYKRKVDQNKCKYYEGLKTIKNTIGQEKGFFDQERLVRDGKAKTFCPYFTQISLIPKADIIICEHKNIFKEGDKQKDIYQFIGMKKGEDNGTFLFIDQAQYLYEDIQSYNTFNIEQQMVHSAINKCRQLKGIIFEEAKLVGKDNLQNVLKKDYEKLIDGLANNMMKASQQEDKDKQQQNKQQSILPKFVKNPISLVEYLQNASSEINILFEKHFVKKKNEIDKNKQLQKKENYVPPQLINEKQLKSKDLLDLKNLYPMPVQLRLVLDELLSYMFQYVYHPQQQQQDDTVIQNLYILSDFLYFFTQNYQSSDKELSPLKIFFQDHPEYLRDAICFPILTVTPTLIRNHSKRIFDSCSNYLLTSDCIVQRNEYHTTTILGLNDIKQRITLRFELEPQVKYNMIPLFITKWNDQSTFESTNHAQKVEDSPLQLRNYVNIINRVCEFTPDGIVVYLPNIAVFMKFITEKRGDILSKRPVYFENPYSPEKTMEAFSYYKKQCDIGQGAFFFCVANGWAGRNIEFNDHYSRALLILGYPMRKEYYQYIQDGQTIYGLDKNEFTSFDTMTRVTQCIKSVYTHTHDYCTVILADLKLMADSDYLPKWANQNLKGQDELTVDDLFQNILSFQKCMGRLHGQ